MVAHHCFELFRCFIREHFFHNCVMTNKTSFRFWGLVCLPAWTSACSYLCGYPQDTDFDSTGGFLGATIGRVKQLSRGSQTKLLCYMLLFCFFVFFVLYWFIKLRWWWTLLISYHIFVPKMKLQTRARGERGIFFKSYQCFCRHLWLRQWATVSNT